MYYLDQVKKCSIEEGGMSWQGFEERINRMLDQCGCSTGKSLCLSYSGNPNHIEFSFSIVKSIMEIYFTFFFVIYQGVVMAREENH